MSTVKFVKKRPAGGSAGNLIYTYKCTCGNGREQNIEVESGNEIQAKDLAQIECDEKCGEL